MMQLNRYTKQVFNDVKVKYRMRQQYTVNTEQGYEEREDQDQIGYLGSRSPRGETALAGEGEGVRVTFDQIIIEQVKTKQKRKKDQGQSWGKRLQQVDEAETVEEQVRARERRRGNELRRGEGQGGGGRGQKGQGRMVKGDRVRAKWTMI